MGVTHKSNIELGLPKQPIPTTEFTSEAEKFVSEKQNDTNKFGQKFTDSIYSNLPEILRFVCDIVIDQKEKELVLIGALGVISGILPNIIGFYNGTYVYPHLYVYILGKYGSGKGALSYCRKIIEPIHKGYLEKYEIEKEDALQENLGEFPVQKILIIPANSSKTGIIELLNANDGEGIIFETEGDTLANTLKQDYGNFSDTLRNAFHHEPINYYRRTGKEYVYVQNPKLAVVLSSTFDQLLNLIPNTENGLCSRFIFYEFVGEGTFTDVFNKSKNKYPEKLEKAGELFKDIYENLKALEGPIKISLTEKQRKEFLETFRAWKQSLNGSFKGDLGGAVNRLGIICFRIMMILTTLRFIENIEKQKELICTDEDFDNALKMGEIFKHTAVSIFKQLPKPKRQAKIPKKDPNAENKILAKEYRKQGMSLGEISKKLRVPKSTIQSWCKQT